MDFKIVILSLACFSCLVPPALGTSLVAAKAAAVGAGAAALAAKGALLKGAAVLGAKAAVAKGALAAGAAIGSHVVANLPHKPSLQIQIPETTVVLEPPRLSTVFDRVMNLLSTFGTAVKQKTLATGSLLASLLPSKTVITKPHHVVVRPEFVVEQDVVLPHPHVVLPPHDVIVPPPDVVLPLPELILPPRPPVVVEPRPPVVLPPPKVPAQPSVAIVGPSLNVYQSPHNDAYYPLPLVEKDC